jgi:Predicted transcriptional regulator with C-terminal CBS domains
MATRKFSELRAAIAADPIRAERLRHATEAVDQSYESYQLNLKQLRQARNLTQAQIARVLGISQPEISRIERQTDVYLSTLESYVAAMGGELKLVVVFNDQESIPVDLADVLPKDASATNTGLTVTAVSEKVVFEGTASEAETPDINEVLATSAVGGERRAQALKGITNHLRQHHMSNLACVVIALAAESLAAGGDSVTAARELGAAGAAARQSRRHRLAEHLWRKSLDFDPTNVRSRSALGQFLHHQGRYREAIENLETVASTDNYATLFLGWSRLMVGLEADDEAMVAAGINDVITGLHRWSYEANRGQRQAWLRNVKRLDDVGRFRQEVDNLLAFASSNSNFGRVTRDDLAELYAVPDATMPQEPTTDSNDEASFDEAATLA